MKTVECNECGWQGPLNALDDRDVDGGTCPDCGAYIETEVEL